MRPRRLVAVVGTGTDVGKTWVSARLLTRPPRSRRDVAARKPAQSFDPGDDPAGLDAAVLGAASGEPPEAVCPPHRWYEVAMAPPMAADVLGRPRFTIADLVEELAWPDGPVDVGLVETAGGVRSPMADDGDCVALCDGVAPDVVLLVADAGLGTINAVRLSVDALACARRRTGGRAEPLRPASDLHQRNRDWLRERDALSVVVLPGDEAALVDLVMGG